MKLKKNEEMGTDLEQMIAMLEGAEVDHDKVFFEDEDDEDDEDDQTITLEINGKVFMVFDPDGSLLDVYSNEM